MEDVATCERPGTTHRNANGACFSHSRRLRGATGAMTAKRLSNPSGGLFPITENETESLKIQENLKIGINEFMEFDVLSSLKTTCYFTLSRKEM